MPVRKNNSNRLSYKLSLLGLAFPLVCEWKNRPRHPDTYSNVTHFQEEDDGGRGGREGGKNT